MPRDLQRRMLFAGLIAGVIVIYLSMVGMVEKFEVRRLINDIVTLGKVLVALPPFLVGYVAVRPRVRHGEVQAIPPRQALLMGLGSGGLAGGLTIAGVALAKVWDPLSVREIFISVSPKLLSILTFDLSLPTAALITIAGGALLGAAGAGLRVVPRDVRRPLTIALCATALMALLQRLVPPALQELAKRAGSSSPRSLIQWLYSTRFTGLTILGAIVTFLVSLVVAVAVTARRGTLRRRIQEMPAEGRRGVGILGLIVLILVVGYLPLLVGSAISEVLGQVGIFVLMGLGLNIVVGYAGLLDLGYVAFFAVGGYFTALLTGALIVTSLGAQATPSFSLNLSFYPAVILVILVAAFAGLLIGAPVLRLRGDYLAIVTLGFGEIARLLVTSDWLRPFVGGAQGLRDVPAAPIAGFGFRDPQHFYWLVLGFIVLAVYVSWRLANSRVGRAWNAMREDEQVAEAMGISTVRYKLLAFAMGAGIGCLSGALFVVKLGTVQPDSFTILVSIQALSVIILGGMGSIPGVIVGALVLIGLPGLLSEFEEFRLLLYGGVLVSIMILRPQGLIPNVRRMRELHEEELEQDAWLKGAGEASVPAAIAIGSERAPS
jgi:branched-chain amino acid transport system permease protein